jgi:hypothetical protein
VQVEAASWLSVVVCSGPYGTAVNGTVVARPARIAMLVPSGDGFQLTPEGEAVPGDQYIVSSSWPRIAPSDLPAEALVNKSVSIRPWRLDLDLCYVNASKASF